MSKRSLVTIVLLLVPVGLSAQTLFAPVQAWKAAILSGDEPALAKLYRSYPPSVTVVGQNRVPLKDELAFWHSLKMAGLTDLNPRVLEVQKSDGGQMRLLMRVSARVGSQAAVISVQQQWVQSADGWTLALEARSPQFVGEAPMRLPQPETPNVNLYPEPGAAAADLKAAELLAGKERKRLLLVFGANWCYDCHVLDATLHSKNFAALVNDNYVVVHISIGEEGKDNNDLAKQVGVNLDKGVPSLAVLEADGKTVFAQTNGEFESAVKIGPEDVRAFLTKWKHKG